MHSADLLKDAFGRIRDTVHRTVGGLSDEQLHWRVDGSTNSIAWLIWHLSRVQDDHVAELAHVEQPWLSAGWAGRFNLPFAPTATGYGHRSDEVAAVRVADPALLLGYHDAVHEMTLGYLDRLTAEELDRVVDTAWDPPVTAGVRLVSVISDGLQHAGQAAFVRGITERG